MTPIALGAVALGQTVFLSTAGIFFLADQTLGPAPASRRDGRGRNLLIILVLFGLGSKPPLAITAGAALIGLGIFRPVLVAVALTALGSLLLTPLLGPGWMPEYFSLMAHYNQAAADPAFAWSFSPGQMSNLRAFLSVDLGIGDDTASVTTNLLWVSSLALVALGGLKRRLQPPLVWASAILLFLLLCSHVSSTQALLLFLVPAILTPWDGGADRNRRILPWLAVPLALLLSPALGPISGLRPSLLWIFQIGFLGWVTHLAILDFRRSHPGDRAKRRDA